MHKHSIAFIGAVAEIKHRLAGLNVPADRLELSLPYDDFQKVRTAVAAASGPTVADVTGEGDRVMTVLGVKIIARVG
jgi:hypothetical protein